MIDSAKQSQAALTRTELVILASCIFILSSGVRVQAIQYKDTPEVYSVTAYSSDVEEQSEQVAFDNVQMQAASALLLGFTALPSTDADIRYELVSVLTDEQRALLGITF